ncbi:MAG: Crp/Fnr family transcriptional regulator [Gemmatimonadota bacterium]|nr:Crp/Fnr family transcriptional regulator [Gemmatimonadota bacterium]
MAPVEPGESSATGENRLLSALSNAGFGKLESELEVAEYESGSILYEPYEPAQFVYFPFSCVVSIVNTVAGGSTVEVGTVGNEGMAGIAVYLDSGVTPNRTLVQVPGRMARLSAASFKAIAEQSPEVRKVINRYTLAFLAQVSQTAACNRAHTIDERCARWLLMTHDRVVGDSFSLTHEFLAFMLGVRRAGVTIAAGILQKAGHISYKRGRIKIIDRKGLEEAACDCYEVVSREFEKLLGAHAG